MGRPKDEAELFNELPWEVIREMPVPAAPAAGQFNRPDGQMANANAHLNAQEHAVANAPADANANAVGRARPGPNIAMHALRRVVSGRTTMDVEYNPHPTNIFFTASGLGSCIYHTNTACRQMVRGGNRLPIIYVARKCGVCPQHS